LNPKSRATLEFFVSKLHCCPASDELNNFIFRFIPLFAAKKCDSLGGEEGCGESETCFSLSVPFLTIVVALWRARTAIEIEAK
jgi:hypothetical protein